MTKIHPTAVVEDGAQIAASAEIGPFCWISSKAKIGENVRLLARVTVYGDTTIGEGTVVFPGAVLGTGPQDHGNEFQDEAKLVIGKRNVIRENVTMHAGTPKGQSDPQDGSTPEKMITRVGDDGMFMVNSHVAHDCVVGNKVIISNATQLAGEVIVDDCAVIGGGSLVHQFCHLGKNIMLQGGALVNKDIPPYVKAAREPISYVGLNTVGMHRHGFSADKIQIITEVYRILYMSDLNVTNAVRQIREQVPECEVRDEILHFVETSQRGIIRSVL